MEFMIKQNGLSMQTIDSLPAIKSIWDLGIKESLFKWMLWIILQRKCKLNKLLIACQRVPWFIKSKKWLIIELWKIASSRTYVSFLVTFHESCQSQWYPTSWFEMKYAGNWRNLKVFSLWPASKIVTLRECERKIQFRSPIQAILLASLKMSTALFHWINFFLCKFTLD